MERRKLKAKRRAGGSQKETQEMDFDPQPNSNSSPSSSLSNVEAELKHEEPSKLDKIPNAGPLKKKLKNRSTSDGENPVGVENKTCIVDLPPEMLMKILNYLNVKNLVASRFVSRKWNEIARETLKSRNDAETVFYCRKTEDGNPKIGGKTKETGLSLKSFIQYFNNSKESPLYTGFRFYDIDPSVFDSADWLKFTSYFGQSVKSLRLDITINPNNSDAELMKLTEKLRNLLLNQLPNLQVFGLVFDYSPINRHVPPFSNIQLFPTTTTSSNEGKTFQLANLKTLYLFESSFSNFPGIVTDLLRAAVNLQKILPFGKYGAHSRFETFQLLQSLGKLQCVQTASIDLDATSMSKIQGQPSAPLAFKLKKLDFHVFLIQKTEGLWLDASVFLSNLFESSKDTLTKLATNQIGRLPDLRLPKFSKLTDLTSSPIACQQEIQVLPSGINLLETFPLLQFLELLVPWTDFFRHHKNANVSQLPSLKSLVITGREMRKEDIAQISQACPNLKELQIGHFLNPEPLNNFPAVGTAIWTHLTKLDSLDLKIDAKSPVNAFPAVDSTFTGFSVEDVIRLDKELVQVQKGAENWGSKIQINSSILDLKDLKNLRVSFQPNGRTPKEMLIVSEKYAFQLMENLKYEF